jgi:REP element-mobilizing transposase RayT
MSFYRRRLPHWQPERAALFVTWRLAGSLPRPPSRLVPQGKGHSSFIEVDRRADKVNSRPLWLKDPRIAELVAKTLLAGELERNFYRLRAWVIMPNHVHVLLHPVRSLPVITRWLKGSTSRRANLLLGRTGQRFWQDESWDRWVRSDGELNWFMRYIEQNPVSAGLVAAPEDWPWSSARRAGGTACPTAG